MAAAVSEQRRRRRAREHGPGDRRAHPRRRLSARRLEPHAPRGRVAGRACATVLDAPADALAEADVCVTCSPTTTPSRVAPQASSQARARAALVEMSTVSVAASERVAERAADAGVDFLRAPVSGNPTSSGPEGDDLRVRRRGRRARLDPLLRASARRCATSARASGARVVKLVLQILIAGTAELLAEALVLGESGRVDRQALLDAIRASVVGSRFVASKARRCCDEDYSATFTTPMMQKDIDLVLDLAARGRRRAAGRRGAEGTARGRGGAWPRGRGLHGAVPAGSQEARSWSNQREVTDEPR